MANHVEAKHVQHEGVVCPLCHKHFATSQAHHMHYSRVRKICVTNIAFVDIVLAQMS